MYIATNRLNWPWGRFSEKKHLRVLSTGSADAYLVLVSRDEERGERLDQGNSSYTLIINEAKNMIMFRRLVKSPLFTASIEPGCSTGGSHVYLNQ